MCGGEGGGLFHLGQSVESVHLFVSRKVNMAILVNSSDFAVVVV